MYSRVSQDVRPGATTDTCGATRVGAGKLLDLSSGNTRTKPALCMVIYHSIYSKRLLYCTPC